MGLLTLNAQSSNSIIMIEFRFNVCEVGCDCCDLTFSYWKCQATHAESEYVRVNLTSKINQKRISSMVK